MYDRDLKDEMIMLQTILRPKPRLIPKFLWIRIVSILIPAYKYYQSKI